MRTSLVFSERAASGIAKLFLGPLVPIVPKHPRLVFQATHADDIGRACRAALHADLEGPVNVVASPVVDADVPADLFDARSNRWRLESPVIAMTNGSVPEILAHDRRRSCRGTGTVTSSRVRRIKPDISGKNDGVQPPHGFRTINDRTVREAGRET